MTFTEVLPYFKAGTRICCPEHMPDGAWITNDFLGVGLVCFVNQDNTILDRTVDTNLILTFLLADVDIWEVEK